MGYRDVILLFVLGAVGAFLLFVGIRIFVGKAFHANPQVDYTHSKKIQSEVKQSIRDTRERMDDYRSEQEQKLSDFKAQQDAQASRTSDLRQQQKDLIESQKQRMRDMQRR